MAVNVYWASDNAGTAIVEPLDHGTVSPGNASTPQTVYIWHDGDYDLTSCAFYMAEYSATYSGTASAAADFAELLAWGDAASGTNWGGYCVNMNASGAFSTPYPSFGTLSVSGLSYCFSSGSGMGSESAEAIALPAEMDGDGGGEAGVVPANPPNGYGTNYKFQSKIIVPSSETTGGIRQFDLVLSYRYTT
jgi:hypothetical protein